MKLCSLFKIKAELATVKVGALGSALNTATDRSWFLTSLASMETGFHIPLHRPGKQLLVLEALLLLEMKGAYNLNKTSENNEDVRDVKREELAKVQQTQIRAVII